MALPQSKASAQLAVLDAFRCTLLVSPPDVARPSNTRCRFSLWHRRRRFIRGSRARAGIPFARRERKFRMRVGKVIIAASLAAQASIGIHASSDNNYIATPLVSNQTGVAPVVDLKLVNG